MIQVRIVKDWTVPDLMLQSPGGDGVWGNCQFSLDEIPECDYLIYLNNRLKNDIDVICPPENIWALMQEPYQKELDWMINGHEQFYRVYTHHKPSNHPRYVTSQPATPWGVLRSFDQLVSISRPEKMKSISFITSSLNRWPGHRKRLSMLGAIQNDQIDIDLYGKTINYIEDKWDGLAPYKYSLSIENSSSPDYWTEKVADCFLCWTVPIYFGCTNLHDYFPRDSFIYLDITDPKQAVDKVKKIIAEDDWESRQSALEEARNLYLYKYQFFPYIADLIESSFQEDTKRVREKITLKHFRQPWHIQTLGKLKAVYRSLK